MSSDTKNNNPEFQVPPGYFDELTNRVLSNVTSKNTDVIETTGFDVPTDYFENLTHAVMQSIEDSENNTPVISLKAKAGGHNYPSWLIPVLSVAALGILLFSIQNFWANQNPSFDSLGDDEIMDYVMNMEEVMDQEATELLFSDNSILEEITIETGIKDQQLLDFLMEEIDLNQMYTQ
jgi:hypothetical protein